jgi:hypothetical protein
MRFLMKRWSCSMMLFNKVRGGTDNADRDRANPLTQQWRGHRRDAPSTFTTRGRIPPLPDNAKRRNSLAAVRSRFGDRIKSIVSPEESTARSRYVH